MTVTKTELPNWQAITFLQEVCAEASTVCLMAAHIPLFVYWKGKIQPVVSDALVCQVDILASLGSMIHADLPEGLDSRNYLDVFFGKASTARKDVVLEAQGRMAYRSGDWIMMPPYKGSERNLTGNELGNLGEYGLFNVKSRPDSTSERGGPTPRTSGFSETKFLCRSGWLLSQ